MKKATYHNAEGLEPVEVFVLKENKDGTVDLGTEDGTLLIGSCQIGTREGACSIIEGKAKASPKAADEKPADDKSDDKTADKPAAKPAAAKPAK